MTTHPRSLRGIVTNLTALLAFLALLGSGSLIVLTGMLHRTTESAAASAQTIRIAEELQLLLLEHDHTRSAQDRAELERRMRAHLERADTLIGSGRAAEVLARVEGLLDSYLAARTIPEPDVPAIFHHAAYAALSSLIRINLEESTAATERASAWNTVANLIGVGVGATTLLVTAGLLLWLKQRVFGPLFKLARAMRDYGRGERHVNAPDEGPDELREMSQQFNEMTRRLAAQQELQMAFLGGIAHDLRSPLCTLDLSVSVLVDEDHEARGPRARRAADRAKRQIRRLDHMIGDVLDLASPEAGELELHSEVCDLREPLREGLEPPSGRDAPSRVEVSIPEEPVFVRGDVRRIERVVMNLVGNALKYSPPESRVRVTLFRQGADAIIRVSDHGVGIAEADLLDVFQPFRRVGAARETVPGTGLGLFVADRIVHAHGGSIEVASEPGRGSTFTVRLPAWTQGQAVAARSPESHHAG